MGDTSISPEEAELAARLRDYLTAQQGHQIDVRALSRLNTGWESDVFAFDTEPALEVGDVSGQSRFVLRLYFGADAAEKARHEGHAYALLTSAGYPVPHVLCVEPSTTVLGRSFLIMERVSGVSLGQRWRDPDPAVQQAATARFCELLAMLHTIAWQELPRANEVTRVTIAQQLAYWLSILNSLKVEGFDAGMAWLQAQHALITPQPLGLVHWDFHHENILVGADETAWVIDWTQFQATDIRFDLAGR